ncbi:hypothetical protein [Actinomadura roseirufa]|uniref:hypothetical protein n=1 Tax=Actinomadura roseirufa TaxID=2094049 RepID=UPI0013F17E7A|nr:hypothetical protein [Actinomadura roseirufa]
MRRPLAASALALAVFTLGGTPANAAPAPAPERATVAAPSGHPSFDPPGFDDLLDEFH